MLSSFAVVTIPLCLSTLAGSFDTRPSPRMREGGDLVVAIAGFWRSGLGHFCVDSENKLQNCIYQYTLLNSFF